MRSIVFDTEATDLTPGQICQLSYLMLDGGRIEGKNMFFAVDEMSEGAFEVHGLSREALDELSGGERFEDRADEVFADFAAAGLWIGHNVSADDRYLRAEMERLGRRLPKVKTFCTMNYFTGVMSMARKVNIGRPKPPKLEELVAFFGLTPEQVAAQAAEWFGGGGTTHDARYDTAATCMCVLEAARQGQLRGVL
ncbi:MAG: 3'-5' exonuclease [Clostridiales bacterium]|nr:3'-5' exonuclease [Clostridiales bacterium]